MFKKGLAVAVILLFVGVAFAPSINADVHKKEFDENLVEICITEYKVDGTNEEKIFEITEEENNDFIERINNIDDIDERLEVYKEYGFIPEDVNSEKLRVDMEEKFEGMGLNKDKINSFYQLKKRRILTNDSLINVNFKCKVVSHMEFGLHLRFGMSAITRFINWLIGFLFLIPSIDLFNIGICRGMRIETTDGLMPDYYSDYSAMLYFIGGFVGYSYKYYTFTQYYVYDGFAAMVFSI